MKINITEELAEEFLAWQEWNKLRSNQIIHQIWHENFLKLRNYEK